ncbi:YbfB/YjiJ family MFS transporter [Bartonella sp. TT29SHDZB]|uniref:YbfB/YjiJ family MFS transporter n=1 Tax=Bartonella sp. TT29SHDZB TaxID=3243581 RepID=UPI0035CF35D2
MLDEGLFTFNQLSYIPSANYGGYLVGSMFFTFGRIGNISLAPHILSCAAIVMSALIIFMALTLGPFDPFAAGVASVAMMILGSILVMQHSHNGRIIASLYAGVGVGIRLGNEYVIISLNMTTISKKQLCYFFYCK